VRDQRVRRALRRQRWVVIQLWETDILRDPKKAASDIRERLGLMPLRRLSRRDLQNPLGRAGTAALKMPPSS
jgi:hypothetical protein